MTVRLTLVCAPARTGRDVRFGDTEPDERALRRARAAAASLETTGTLYAAPSHRCRQTAQALGWLGVTVEAALRDLDMGRWQGRTPEEVADEDPAALTAWMTDPEAAPHGGESVGDLCRRVAAWMDALPDGAGRVLAVVDQAVVRAAVLSVLAAPAQSFWRVDVPPLAKFECTGRAGRWNLRLGDASPTNGSGRVAS
ncbi:histidine phosphatase family protein [Streptomyces cupreus]|uniref:Histidine phosphatase family protein n=1 Tax=Streptomyces cupreus TaxID=2759956 RepID=A0A7X1JBW3_9ACTN|nr:histidine phosphatase family protein [Streptomyces cupreus]MBC2907445.1 histidine phosphatase family protein [Streptomyces cupreus]